jgi:hypothetical protein
MEMFFNSKQLPINRNNQSAIFFSFKPLFFTDKFLETKHCPNVMFIDHEYEPVPNVVHVGESSNKQMYINYARNYVIL